MCVGRRLRWGTAFPVQPPAGAHSGAAKATACWSRKAAHPPPVKIWSRCGRSHHLDPRVQQGHSLPKRVPPPPPLPPLPHAGAPRDHATDAGRAPFNGPSADNVALPCRHSNRQHAHFLPPQRPSRRSNGPHMPFCLLFCSRSSDDRKCRHYATQRLRILGIRPERAFVAKGAEENVPV